MWAAQMGPRPPAADCYWGLTVNPDGTETWSEVDFRTEMEADLTKSADPGGGGVSAPILYFAKYDQKNVEWLMRRMTEQIKEEFAKKWRLVLNNHTTNKSKSTTDGLGTVSLSPISDGASAPAACPAPLPPAPDHRACHIGGVSQGVSQRTGGPEGRTGVSMASTLRGWRRMHPKVLTTTMGREQIHHLFYVSEQLLGWRRGGVGHYVRR